MAQYRDYADSFTVGYEPPTITWTVVKGDTAAFRVYVTDNNKNPLNIPDWTIKMDIVPPNTSTPIVELTPEATLDDGPGQFTVTISAEDSALLSTGDRFDIQMSNASINSVWTVGMGTMIMIDSVTE